MGVTVFFTFIIQNQKTKDMKKVILFFAALMVTAQVFSCTDIVVGKKASKDSSVIVAHTECGPDCRIRVVPGQTFEKGAMAPVYWGMTEINGGLEEYGEIIGYIPQVEKTYTYFHSAYSHINEHQLAIAESTISQREELKINRAGSQQIMTIEQAMAFALQRCKTAEEALTLITKLLDEYGFLPSCIGESEALCIADTEEVWILEVFSVGEGWTKESGKPGAIWAAQRVPDDHVTIIPNWSIIKEINIKDKDNFRASKNYQSVAIEKGWYDPKGSEPFVWQDVYSPVPREWATGRFWLFFNEVAPDLAGLPKRDLKSPFDGQHPYIQYVEPLSVYPFSVKPQEKLSVDDVKRLQRSVFSGSIYDMTSDPDWYIPKDGEMKLSPLATPFPTKDMRELLDITWRRNVVRTGYGMIAQLRGWLPDEIGGIYWVYQDNQYCSPYVPIYVGVTDVHETYKTYDSEAYDENSARWTYDMADNLLYLKWQEASKDLEKTRDGLEKRFYEEMPEIEKKALELYKQDPAKAQQLLTEYTSSCMETSVEEYRELIKLLITKYTNNRQGS